MRPLPLLCCLIAIIVQPSLCAAQDLPDSFDGARTVVYKTVGDVELKMHIFSPEQKADMPRPAIVFFFGGGWRAGTPEQFEQHCRYLASRGMVAATAEYRVSSRHKTQAKHCVQDGKSAVRWLRTHADELGIDPQRIAAGGGSAGGHVAACTGTLEEFDEPGESTDVSARPDALVLYNPAAALAPFDGQEPLPEYDPQSMRKRVGTDPVDLSPAHHVGPDVPPTIMFFGTADRLLAGARYFREQMLEAGNRCELKLTDGAGHGFFNYGRGGNEAFRTTLEQTDRFLASLGYLKGEPQVDEFLASQKQKDQT
ncbi:Carboxylesterase NlhH [Maioricimonas rarisocia]|uniref:Carboxylesterase NlhH n=1 Tax=Maioricimonas rarisocia TaxID=2528026 RepID=A0A517Z4E4_9PLAN|nr:alpha/beta hydrolase [Maioricimonas rarisocia]QDU37353.1 Carboxylesterase NlhH [Maioricimonas rarisocia]